MCSRILPAGRSRRWPNEKRGEKEKGRVDLFGERYRARAHQLSPRLRAVVSYINDNREVVLEQTAMEIATATQTSDATVVRAIRALGFAGLRELKQTMERWFGTSVTSAEKMRSTVTALASDVNSSIDFVLEGHQRVCEVLSRADNRAAVARAVALLSDARGGDLRHRRLGDPRRVHRPAVQPHWPAGLRDEPHGL